jgi:hypothetical protein
MAIDRELPPGLTGQDAGERAEELDISLVDHYLSASRKGVTVSIDSVHLAQLCNEVWRRRRQAAEANPVLQGLREKDARERGLVTAATAAIVNVGHSLAHTSGKQHEATAIVQVANMLAELMQWRAGERRPNHEAAREIAVGMVLHGKVESITALNSMLGELERLKRLAEAIEDLGWSRTKQ